MRPSQLPQRSIQLPLRPFQVPLRPTQLPRRPSQLIISPFFVVVIHYQRQAELRFNFINLSSGEEGSAYNPFATVLYYFF